MDLPDEIVVDILRRLPVKSLVRFRCVSKSWRSLISNPTFVRTHLSRMKESHISLGTASRMVLSRFADTLYWLFIDDAVSRYVILRFDLVEERFRVVRRPPDESCLCITWLGSLRDSLCVINTQKARASHFHVWSTKDDKTWTKLFTVPMLQRPAPSLRSSYLYKPLCYTKTGALLMKLRGAMGFVMFEPEENKFRQFAVRGVEYHLQEILYCESLVSPNCDGNEDEED